MGERTPNFARHGLTRRRLVQLGVISTGAVGIEALLAACGISPAASPASSPITSALAASSALPTQVKDTGEVVLVGFGGTYQAAQSKAFHEPFSKETGIKVSQGTTGGIAQAKAQVESGHPSFDMEDNNVGTMLIGMDSNLWMLIDYSFFRKEDLANIPPSLQMKYGAPTIAFVECMTFNLDIFPDGKPQPSSWADFWDLKKFPGKRGMFRPDTATTPLPEIALLADGVPPEKLYPLDSARAIKKLQSIVGNVVWFTDPAQPPQALANGQVVMAMDNNGRAQVLIDKGAKLKIVWNQSRLAINVWNVLRGAPNWVAAMKLIAYASRPEGQALMAQLTGNAPTNTAANDLLDDAAKRKMATYPANLKLTYSKDESWWYQNRTKWIELALPALGLA